MDKDADNVSDVHRLNGKRCPPACMDPEGGQWVQTPPRKSLNKGFPGFPDKAHSHQASIQIRAIIGLPAKRNLNDVLLAGR